MKKLFLVILMLVIICFCSCNNNNSSSETDTDLKSSDKLSTDTEEIIKQPDESTLSNTTSIEEESKEQTPENTTESGGIGNSEIHETLPPDILWLHLKSIDAFKSFLDKEERDTVLQNYYISLTEKNIQDAYVISDTFSNGTLYTVSNDDWTSITIRDDSPLSYSYYYNYENFFVEFDVIISERSKIALEEQGLVGYFKTIRDTFTEIDGGYIDSNGDIFTPIEFTVGDERIDTFYITRPNGSAYIVFELENQTGMLYLKRRATFEEDIQLLESLGIHQLNFDKIAE